jgi:hypothetical protein
LTDIKTKDLSNDFSGYEIYLPLIHIKPLYNDITVKIAIEIFVTQAQKQNS